jgi:two-component system, NarL family, invasion response regulator UvrY
VDPAATDAPPETVPPAGPDVRVLVVDDQPPFRRAAAAVLRRTPGFVLVGEAGSGEEAVAVAAPLRPDLVLMDIHRPGMSGIAATRQVVGRLPEVVVVLCSTHDRADLPADAATCGARAYVHKEELAPHLLRALWDDSETARTFALPPRG